MRKPIKRKTAGLAIALWVQIVATGPSVAQDDLFILETTVSPEANVWYQHHYGDTTRPAFEQRFAAVYADPDANGRVTGTLATTARWDPYLHFAWTFTSEDGADVSASETWREDVGDWGYGIHQFVLDTLAGWVRLPPGPYGSTAWAQLASDGMQDGFLGEVRSISGSLVNLDSVQAIDIVSGRRVVVSGTMFIESIKDSQVVFRPEILADMPCGEEETVRPQEETVRYSAPTSRFVTATSRPRFVPAYPKGC